MKLSETSRLIIKIIFGKNNAVNANQCAFSVAYRSIPESTSYKTVTMHSYCYREDNTYNSNDEFLLNGPFLLKPMLI